MEGLPNFIDRAVITVPVHFNEVLLLLAILYWSDAHANMTYVCNCFYVVLYGYIFISLYTCLCLCTLNCVFIRFYMYFYLYIYVLVCAYVRYFVSMMFLCVFIICTDEQSQREATRQAGRTAGFVHVSILTGKNDNILQIIASGIWLIFNKSDVDRSFLFLRPSICVCVFFHTF